MVEDIPMREDRLHHDADEIHNLDDLIEARSERTSHFARETDAFETDIEINEEIDVDHALTFPHPKHHHGSYVEFNDDIREENMDEDWDAQDTQPTDYEHNYNEGTSTFANDSEEELMEEKMHEISHLDYEAASDGEPVEIMPSKFTPDEEPFI